MTTPTTITDEQGNTWTYVPSPLEGEFTRAYVCGKREATLMTPRGSSVSRLITPSGKRLATVRA